MIETPDRPLAGLFLLVVEDDPDLREVLCETLERFGAKLCCAANGHEALACLDQNPIQLILSDIRMPGGDGLDFLQLVRKRDPLNPPFLFISGYADLPESEALARGAQGLFPKPFDPDELVAAIRKFVSPRVSK